MMLGRIALGVFGLFAAWEAVLAFGSRRARRKVVYEKETRT